MKVPGLVAVFCTALPSARAATPALREGMVAASISSTIPFSEAIVVLLLSYLIGCICTGYWLIRLRTGQDVRSLGSGSTGATNVGRVLGRWGFAATLLGDTAKGALAVWLARHFTGDLRLEVLAGGGVIAGHIWPAPLRFRGGKGLATALGALVVFDAMAAVCYAAMVATAFLLSRNVTVSGLLAVALVPAVFLVRGADGFTLLGTAVIVALILFAHRKNLAEQAAAWTRRRHPASAAQPPTPPM